MYSSFNKVWSRLGVVRIKVATDYAFLQVLSYNKIYYYYYYLQKDTELYGMELKT